MLFVLSSCKKDGIEPMDIENQENINCGKNEGQIILGKQLQDPYTLENMKKAYSNLKLSKSGTPDHEIQPTHKYIRFLPKDETEWGILKTDTLLILYDFPLDYEIEDMGTYYHDPTLPEDAITWQYCVVPIEYIVPNIYNELIYEVYIPGKEKNRTKNSSSFDQFFTDLEHESVKLTGNLPDTENQKSVKSSKWTPKGTIEVWDNIIGITTNYTQVFDHWEYYDCDEDEDDGEGGMHAMGGVIEDPRCKRAVYRYVPDETQGSFIPLIGANVHARWFTHIETDITDADGYFQTSKFRYSVNYAIKWDRGYYDIRNGMIWQAWDNGPKKKGDWNVRISGGKSIMYATMHRAAYKHYYGNNLGIRRPILGDGGRAKLCYIDKEGTGVFWGEWDDGILPDIKIWGKSTLTHNYKNIDEVFSTTVHELGHFSHWMYIGVFNYAQTSKTVYESWADAVQWALTNDEYHTMGERFGGDAAIAYNCPWTN